MESATTKRNSESSIYQPQVQFQAQDQVIMELYDWDRWIFKAQKVLIVQRSNSSLLIIAKKQMKQQLERIVESLQSISLPKIKCCNNHSSNPITMLQRFSLPREKARFTRTKL
jgi:anion-transporting  ArsA/GET3 family ATPase